MADWDDSSPGDSDIVSQYPANERAARAAVVTNFGIDHHEANDGDVGKHEVIQLLDEAGDPTITAGEIGIWNNAGALNTRAGAGDVERVATREYVDTAIGASAFAAGTKMVFFQASAPTGWTQDAAVNDRVLRVVSGSGGGTGGSWTISGVTVDSHVLTTAEMPSHTHGGTTNSDSHSHTGTANSNGNHNHHVARSGESSSSLSTSNSISETSPSPTGDQNSDYILQGKTSGTFIGDSSTTGAHTHSLTINSDAHSHTFTTGSTGSGDGHDHGLTADGNWRPQYIDVIVCERD